LDDNGLAGTRVARLRVLFRLPQVAFGVTVPQRWPGDVLAYVELYPKAAAADATHSMCAIRRTPQGAKNWKGKIIPLCNIRQVCQLIPAFGTQEVNRGWNSDSVLDESKDFYLNNWKGVYSYQTIW
jgi:hypothetical protein